MSTDLPELDVFYGELTVNRALIYARLPRPADDAGLTLAGQVRGPRCLHAQTLPLTAPLKDLGAGPTLLARAVVPEPTFWSPDLPAIYDVTIDLRHAAQTIATARREVGLRSLGVRGRHLLMAGKPWVLRGVWTASTTAALPREWHDDSTAFVALRPGPEPLDEASQWGALAVAHVTESGESAATQLRQLARHPGAAIAVLDRPLPNDFKKSATAPNLLLAQQISRQDSTTLSTWADVVVMSVDDADYFLTVGTATRKPIIVNRPLSTPTELPRARLQCDVLQRDLAPIGQFAGYIV